LWNKLKSLYAKAKNCCGKREIIWRRGYAKIITQFGGDVLVVLWAHYSFHKAREYNNCGNCGNCGKLNSYLGGGRVFIIKFL
jgi:hypothetical protein